MLRLLLNGRRHVLNRARALIIFAHSHRPETPQSNHQNEYVFSKSYSFKTGRFLSQLLNQQNTTERQPESRLFVY